MNRPGFIELMGFGEHGWGATMLHAALITLAVAICGFLVGAVIGVFAAWAKVQGGPVLRRIADAYTTVLRGIPDLLVIYLFYFGGSSVLSTLGHLFGQSGFIGIPGFLAGALAVGVASGAHHTEVFRGAYAAVPKGEIEAAMAIGMSRPLRFRRIIAPLTLRTAIPALGNVWQLVLKESALVSVTGVVELLRQAQIGSGSTRQPFDFFLAAGILYLVISTISGWIMSRAERHYSRGMRRA
ncbi:amino acid ABC transporter membrane protein 1, PAAT family [Faunimonas pinastri]|uniref:Amino acid ABC transporter membrane protein 1, PAAT family n=1 Tax=Faunimonas pinastri TaxID=1855383 RepID=A0A1H9AK61_9HYPH|nr:ABC transporter permease subunit [Faunimonas pinastri]SEP77154.1 amino acid ABC transporter membrane protein 1, PAAT family [Faunimonas pinastri]